MSFGTNSGDPIRPPRCDEHLHLDERRQWMRFGREPGTDYASIVQPESLAGWIEVADESLGGLGFVVGDDQPFHIGQELEIDYAGGLHRSRVRHISVRPDGFCVIGVSNA